MDLKFLRRIFLTTVSLVILSVFLLTVNSSAEDNGEEIHGLKEKIERLEKRQAELYHSREEKKAIGLMDKISDNITLGGLIEVEASAEDRELDGTSNDIVLATVELGLDAQINEHVQGHILLLWEDGSTGLDVDEGTITITRPGGFSITAGKTYVPFGVFNSHFVSDPQTLELGETGESLAIVFYENDNFNVSGGAFNGDIDEASTADVINDYFASISVNVIEGVSLAGYYMTDIAETNVDILSGATLTEKIGGIGGSISAEFGQFVVEGEYLGAIESYRAADLDLNSDGSGDQPQAWNLELAYGVNDRTEVAVKYEGNKDFPSAPESQYGVAASYGLFENVSIAAELLFGEFETGEKRTLFATNLGVEF